MTYVLLAIIVLLALMLARVLQVVMRTIERDQQHRYTSEPSNLSAIVTNMLRTVEERDHWEATERMRDELRGALAQIDRMRHDQGRQALRASKPPRSVKA
jgi:ABC-type transport system involved in cytochrome bd biosynthesis fused ATPase/permease subunit